MESAPLEPEYLPAQQGVFSGPGTPDYSGDYIEPPPAPQGDLSTITDAQLRAMMQLSKNGSMVRADFGPDGILLIQDITGYGIDSSPNPWVLMGIDGSTALLAPSLAAGEASGTDGTTPSLRMDVPPSGGLSFVATNSSPVEAMVLVEWDLGASRVNAWKRLAPGEVWVSTLAVPEGATGASAGVLITRSQSSGRYENDMVSIVAAATD